MGGIINSLGLMAISKGGAWLVNKAQTKAQSQVKNFTLNTIFSYVSGVQQGIDQDFQKGSQDYRQRAHFNWEQTGGNNPGLWHGERFVDGETLNQMLQQQQTENGEQADAKITLDDFRKMLDKVPEDGAKQDNKGFLRLIRKDGKLVLDKVGAKGLGGVFINFRCNLTAEHNRQVRALFVDSMMEDLKGFFPSLTSTTGALGADALGAESLLAQGKITQKMDAIYTKLTNLLSADKKVIPDKAGGDGTKKAAVLAQKLQRTEIDDILRMHDDIFKEENIRPVFDTLISDACDIIGLEAEGEKTKKQVFMERFGASLNAGLGKDYDQMLTDLCRGKVGKEVGQCMRKMADVLQNICRQEVIEQEVKRVRKGEEGVFFQEGAFATGALETELKATARQIVEDMKGEKPKDSAEKLTVDFLREILPYMLQKCTQVPAYRADFSLTKIKEGLAKYINDLKAIRDGAYRNNDTNCAIIEAALNAQRINAENRLRQLEATMDTLQAKGTRNDDPQMLQVYKDRFALQSDLERIEDNCKFLAAVRKGTNEGIPEDSRVGIWLKGLSAEQRVQLKSYLDAGLTVADPVVFGRWLDHHWAEQEFHVKLPFPQDFLAIQKQVGEAFENKAIQALVANTSKVGEENLQDLIAKLGNFMMDKTFADRIGKKLKDFNAAQLQNEGVNTAQIQHHSVVEGLISSFVKAAIERKISTNEKMSEISGKAMQRANFVAGKLNKVCGDLMSTWGGTVLAEFNRSLHAYFNKGNLRVQEVKDQMDAFRRDLGHEIGEKLFGSFSADLADIVSIEDEKVFQGALDERLANYAARAEKACHDKANAIVYGLLGFNFEDKPPVENPAEDPSARFQGAERVGQGYVKSNNEFCEGISAEGTSDVFSPDELRQAFDNTSKSVWMDVVVKNAPGRGNAFTEFVTSKALETKEKVKGMAMEVIVKNEEKIPKFIRKLVKFDEWKLVKAGKGLFQEDLANAKIDDKWVSALQKNFVFEMSERLLGYRMFEDKFLAECDKQICAKLAELKGGSAKQMLGALNDKALAVLAQDVRKQICLGNSAIKAALKQILAQNVPQDNDITLKLLVSQTLEKISNVDISTALTTIAKDKQQVLGNTLKTMGNLAHQIEYSLEQTVCASFNVKNISAELESDKPNGMLRAFAGPFSSFLPSFAAWTSGRVQSSLQANALQVYNHFVEDKDKDKLLDNDPNEMKRLVKRACEEYVKDFEVHFGELRQQAEDYVAKFPPEDQGSARIGLQTLLGRRNPLEAKGPAESKGINTVTLDCVKQTTSQDCLAVFTQKLQKMSENDPACAAYLREGVQKELNEMMKRVNAGFEAWTGSKVDGYEPVKEKIIDNLKKAADEYTHQAVSSVLKIVDGDKSVTGKTVREALTTAKEELKFAYDSAIGNKFSHCADVSHEVKKYADKQLRNSLLNEIRAEIKKDASSGLIREVDEPTSQSEYQQNWFADLRLQRAFDHVMAESNEDIVALVEVCGNYEDGDDDWKVKLRNHLQGRILEVLRKNDASLRKGLNAIDNAYQEALTNCAEIKINFRRPNVPSGTFRTAVENLLECYMPRNGKQPTQDPEKVVKNYVGNVQSVSAKVLEDLSSKFKKSYNKEYEKYVGELLKVQTEANKLPPEIQEMYRDHCNKVFVDMVSWAMSEVINGADTEKMGEELEKYLIYDFHATVEMFNGALADTNLVMGPGTFSALLQMNVSAETPEMRAVLGDASFKRLVSSAQKQIWSGILAAFEKTLGRRLQFNEERVSKLIDGSIRPVGEDPLNKVPATTPAVKNPSKEPTPSEKWIAAEAKILQQIRKRLVYSLEASLTITSQPKHLVDAATKGELRKMVDDVHDTLDKAYRDFFAKHENLLDEALQAKTDTKGYEHSLFTDFRTWYAQLNPAISGSDVCKLSLEKLLELHRFYMEKAASISSKAVPQNARKHADALKAHWLRYADRRAAMDGKADPNNVKLCFAQNDDGSAVFAVTDKEIRDLHSEVTSEPDDFLESIAYDGFGKPKAELAELVQAVAQDILDADKLITANLK